MTNRHFYNKPNSTLGFTLIELSIVLVIIGLIVGGVLVGQDLIKAAEIRATVSQYEKYNAEVNTFRTKYSAIPGDIACATAFNLGFTGGQSGSCTGLDGTAGKGDGNGMIEGGASGSVLATGEVLLFWRDLSDANLIDGNYGAALGAAGAPTAATAQTVMTYVPPAKAGRGNYWTVGSNSGLNYYVLTGFGSTPFDGSGNYSYASNLTPIETYNIDTKVDDGMPNTGIVVARGAVASSNPFLELSAATGTTDPAPSQTASTDGKCTMLGASVSDPADIYNRNIASGGNTPSCALRMRFN